LEKVTDGKTGISARAGAAAEHAVEVRQIEAIEVIGAEAVERDQDDVGLAALFLAIDAARGSERLHRRARRGCRRSDGRTARRERRQRQGGEQGTCGPRRADWRHVQHDSIGPDYNPPETTHA
jgi:hypothetical protein